MTVPTGTFQSHDVVGVREELADIIYDVSPLDTPFLSLAKQVEAENTLFEWQTDALASPSNNKAKDGDDAPGNEATPTVLLNNRTQISTKDARVSGTTAAVNTAGRADELDYQMLKRGKELKRDMEFVLLSNKAKVAGADAVERETAGLTAWIATNVDAVGADPTGDGTDAATNGTQRAFTEDQLKTVLLGCFNEGGNPDTLMVGGFNRQIASSFSSGKTVIQKAEDPKLHASFDVYVSDFGTLKIIPNRFQRSRDANVLQMDMWQVAFLPGRNMLTIPLAVTGDSKAKQILSEYGLRANNEKASGIIRDLTTS